MGVFDPFKSYPDASSSDLPPDIPSEYRSQLESLLQDIPDVESIANLKIASSGNAAVGGPSVVNRPWEWIEHLGDGPALIENEFNHALLKGREPVKNTGSLSLSTFGARPTGDTIPPRDPLVRKNLETFEDSLALEGPFVRDWRDSRFGPSDDVMKSTVREQGEGMYSPGLRVTTPHGGGSPASTSKTSSRQSPSVSGNRVSSSGSNPSEAIDVDSFGSTSHKRKGGLDSDDEVEIIYDSNAIQSKKPRLSNAGVKKKR